MSSEARVVAVVVTWNRRDLLVEALEALRKQSVPVARVVVVDNASDDGSSELIRTDFPEIDLVTLGENTGGAGGFAVGMERALDSHDPEAVWLMDDDTIPEPTALEELLRVREAAEPTPVLLASKVIWTDGRDHPMNTPRRKPGVRPDELRRAADVGAMPIRSASFVSILCDAATVRERGQPIADYFLWNDDFEFTTRLVRDRTALYCPASVVVHKTKAFGSTDADPGERFYYEVRNKVWLFSRSGGLKPVERAVYAGSTLRRWVRTFASSGDRATLGRALRRGLADGVRRAPRDNATTLASAREIDQ